MASETAEHILDVAQNLVVAGGYNGFSYADIAEEIGIRKASIHHHFPTKAELTLALVNRYTALAADGLAYISREIPDPEAKLNAYLGYWEKCITDGSQPFCLCAMLAGEIEMLPEPVAAKVRGHFENLAAWLAQVLKAGVEQKRFWLTGTPEAEAHILLATVHGAMLSARALGNPALFGTIVRAQLARPRP